ncbi:MAG: carboxyvinyl-carboxyphosphonate phosphorylmutase [Burkholderiales bacterium]|jgi:2-methylisocitrate lyase-like PEP mutase family enzyme|nr:carboxyvinyl-carboxyphosphonate phosphorylmutase [Burkholderiales bacterium]
MKTAARLRSLLREERCIIAPGVADALAARLVALEGFDAIYMTGFGTSLTRLGMPDVGLLTATEMVDNASRIADASGLPLIADADTGYGNPINVRRTIRDYEKAGVAGVHLEDQAWPKRCGHLSGKRVIPAAEMVAKIQAACDARHDADFLIISRTDAIAVEGLAAALERGERYREAGADMLFIEAPVGRAEVERVARHFQGVPLLYNMAASGKTPDLPADELGRLGFRLAIYPNWVILAAIPAMQSLLRELKRTGGIAHLRDKVATFKQFTDIAGLPEIQRLEQRYGLPDDQRAGH